MYLTKKFIPIAWIQKVFNKQPTHLFTKFPAPYPPLGLTGILNELVSATHREEKPGNDVVVVVGAGVETLVVAEVAVTEHTKVEVNR